MKSVIGLGVLMLAAIWTPAGHAACTCAGGTPTLLSFQSTIGSGNCGHLESDTDSNFYDLACGGLYFGGAGVGLPLPAILPDYTASLYNVSCNNDTLTLSNTTSVQTGSNRTCSSVNCLYGGPLAIPNLSHNGSATSTCVVNVVSTNASGTADCGTGQTALLNLPLSSNVHLTGDLLGQRCSEGGASCATLGAKCGPTLKGKCLQDTGRCKGGTTPPAGTPCLVDGDCDGGAGATCETGICVGGTQAGHGCIVGADCPATVLGGAATGCAPGTKAMSKCGDTIFKGASKLTASMIKCHLKQEDAAFDSTAFDENACEEFDSVKHKSAKEVYDAAIAKVAVNCSKSQVLGATTIRDTILAGHDIANGAIYCEGTTPIDPGGDDAGFIPTTADSKKCEETFAKNISKLAATVIKCHIKNAAAISKGKPFDKNACIETDPIKHKGAHEVFIAATNTLIASGVCTDACQSATNQNNLAITLIANADAVSAQAYPCGTCDSLVEPCPICAETASPGDFKCSGGPNDGLACAPGDTAVNSSYPTSHDCPPPPAANLGALPIGYALTSGSTSRTSVDLPDQVNVFCGFCKNKITNAFKNLGGNVPVPCTSNADCSSITGFTSCGQRTAGAFSALDVARTITGTGSPAAGGLTTGAAPKATNLVSIFCIPPTFNTLVDASADLPGPGFADLPGVIGIQ